MIVGNIGEGSSAIIKAAVKYTDVNTYYALKIFFPDEKYTK